LKTAVKVLKTWKKSKFSDFFQVFSTFIPSLSILFMLLAMQL